MEYEIDFLPVGEESKGGDAICLRYWDPAAPLAPQFVGVIDGGNKETGEKIVSHIKAYYGSSTVNVVINTHPHADHTAGLPTVLEKLNVKLLYMHKPSDHAAAIKDEFEDGRVTAEGIAKRFRDAFPQADELHKLALKLKIPVREPFAEKEMPSAFIRFMSPTEGMYRKLLLEFEATPEAPTTSLFAGLVTAAAKAIRWVQESWDKDGLVDPVEGATAENETSAVTLLTFDDRRLLLTADAGVRALDVTCAVADILKIPLRAFTFFQIPHHGSKRNLGPTVLNKLVGEFVAEGTSKLTAFVSVPQKGEPKHPSRRVTNALVRRGAKVIQTKGTIKWHYSSGAPRRDGWVAADPIPFFKDVEEDEGD